MPKYWIKITHNNSGKVVSLYSPDLQKELLESNEVVNENFNYKEYVSKKLAINSHLAYTNDKPKKLKQLQNVPLTYLQRWESFELERQNKKGLFAKILPASGHIFNFLVILTSAFITFMALRLTSNDEKHSSRSTALSIAGTVFESAIILFLYILSGASKTLEIIGQKLDFFFNTKAPQPEIPKPKVIRRKKKSCISSTAYITTFLLAEGCILTNTTISGVKTYQESMLLTEKYLDLYQTLNATEKSYYFDLIKWLIIVNYIFAASYCNLAFQGSFVSKLLQWVDNKFANVEKVQAKELEEVIPLENNERTGLLEYKKTFS